MVEAEVRKREEAFPMLRYRSQTGVNVLLEPVDAHGERAAFDLIYRHGL